MYKYGTNNSTLLNGQIRHMYVIRHRTLSKFSLFYSHPFTPKLLQPTFHWLTRDFLFRSSSTDNKRLGGDIQNETSTPPALRIPFLGLSTYALTNSRGFHRHILRHP